MKNEKGDPSYEVAENIPLLLSYMEHGSSPCLIQASEETAAQANLKAETS